MMQKVWQNLPKVVFLENPMQARVDTGNAFVKPCRSLYGKNHQVH